MYLVTLASRARLSAKQGALESRYALPRAGDMLTLSGRTVIFQSPIIEHTWELNWSVSKSAEKQQQGWQVARNKINKTGLLQPARAGWKRLASPCQIWRCHCSRLLHMAKACPSRTCPLPAQLIAKEKRPGFDPKTQHFLSRESDHVCWYHLISHCPDESSHS